MRTGLILDVCTVYLCIPLARTSRVCTMYIRRPYNMVGVHSYEHAQQPQTAAARACHPSAARLYSRHTGLESTEWVCCASSGGQAGRQAVSFFPHTPIRSLPSVAHLAIPTVTVVTAQNNECNSSELRGPATHPRWRKASAAGKALEVPWIP